MMQPRRRRFAAQGDDGAVLILALVIVTTVALVTGAVLTRGDGSLRATVALRSAAATTYAGDAAADVAINDLRRGYGFSSNPAESGFNNSLDGYGCFGNKVGLGGTDTLTLPSFYPGAGPTDTTSAVVQCAAESGTGMESSPVPINSKNTPGAAILTLGGPLTTTDPLKVHGGVFSNSTIIGPVSLDAGDAWANGACAQTTVAATAKKQCNTGQTIPDPGVDPATADRYVSDLGGTVPSLMTPPTTCTNGVAVFKPGYYDNAATVTAATNLCSVAWFEPGPYYFDFHNDSCANVCPSNLYGSGGTSSNVWRISGATVVGGTPTDADGHVLDRPPTNPTMPGACQSPITDTGAEGVQFVFGGNSQVYLDQNSRVELCGSYHADRPPIEMYGLKSGSVPTPSSPAHNYGSTISVTDGTFTGATGSNLQKADANVASWTPTSTTAKSATVTDQGFAPGATVPAGSVLTGATLKITHKDADATNSSKGAAVLSIGSTATASYDVPASATSTTYQVPLSATDFNKLQKEVHDHGYAGASVAYTANMKASGNGTATATLDAITLDLTYYVPVLRGESGTCIDGSVGSCQLISMKNGNNKILFYLQGTTYIPAADASILLGNFSAEVAKFGIIARQLEFSITNGNPSWTGPIFEIPDDTPGYGYSNTTVDLAVFVCPGAGPCPTGGTPSLTARVQLWDPSGDPEPPGRQVTILSWSHPR
jgi:hypothetical protein